MNSSYKMPVNSHLQSSYKSLGLSRSLSDISEKNLYNIFSSESSSTDEISHTGAVVQLRNKFRAKTCVTEPDASPLSGTCVNLDENISIVNDEQVKCDPINPVSDRYSEEFKEKETHIFVLSQSGKPIFSRYGTDSQIAAFIGVMQAMVSFVEADDDKLKIMTAGNHNFVFFIRENMILVAVSRCAFVPHQLRIMLNYIYHQILSILTFRTISKAFQKNPGLDLRRLLVGTDRYLNGLIEYMEHDMGPLLNAVICVPMQATLRQLLLNAISQAIKVNVSRSIVSTFVILIIIAQSYFR